MSKSVDPGETSDPHPTDCPTDCPTDEQGFERVYTKEDVKRHLKAAAHIEGETPTYRAMKRFSRDMDAPHPAHIDRIFGGYNAALRVARLDANMTGHKKSPLRTVKCPLCGTPVEASIPRHMRGGCEKT